MELKQYVNQKKQIYDNMIQYLANNSNSEIYFQYLIKQIDIQQYKRDKAEFKLILILLNKITKNFHRHTLFQERIKKIISHYEEYIKQTFTNTEIYNIFKNNKQIILLLFNMKILIINQTITKLMLKKIYDLNGLFQRCFSHCGCESKAVKNISERQFNNKNFLIFFYPEIKPFLKTYELLIIEKEMSKQNISISNDFDKKRQIGENESYICQLIRQDSIDEFVIYVNQTNQSLSDQIIPSIFETNRFLIKRRPTLIEYAAFYGSIQIFQYLRLNNVELSPSLWLYAIHGKNPEIIHLLEQDQIIPEDKSYLKCFKESIKCHHNDIAYYIDDNLIDQGISNDENNYKKNSIAFGFKYHNYKFFNENISNSQYAFYYASMNDYMNIVKILIKSENVDVNKKIISKFYFLIKII